MDKESFPTGDVETSIKGDTPKGIPSNSAAPEKESGAVSLEGTTAATSANLLVERRRGDRRGGDRRVEERRTESRREDADRRGTERRFLTMEALEAHAESDDSVDSPMRREGGLWPSLDWRPGDNRMAQRRASERRIDDRRQEDRRKTDRRSRGRRASDHKEDLYHGQVQLDENIDDLLEAGDYKGGAD